jgi:hypothetical protein
MRSVAVVVQGCPAPGRPGIDKVKASIEASDIGTNYQWRVQPPGMSIEEHMYDCMRAGRDTGADLVLRLEDDVLVNRHILYNLGTWKAPDDPRFGLGWAFDPGGRTGWRARFRTRLRADRWEEGLVPFSQAVLMRPGDIEDIIVHSRRYFDTIAYYGGAQDNALTYAVAALGKQVAVHAPSLSEHLIEQMPSQFGHRHAKPIASSNGSFDPDWKRGEPIRDRYGRLVTLWR